MDSSCCLLPPQGACTADCSAALRLTAKLVPKFMSVQMAMAWPLTLAGKISPIITHEMGPKLICSVNETLMGDFPKSRACELALTGLPDDGIYTQNHCSSG